jgi:hypothetical protein
VDLENSEALLFCPTAYLDINDPFEVSTLRPLRSSYIKLRVRKRVTEDGERSIMATITPCETAMTFSTREAKEE